MSCKIFLRPATPIALELFVAALLLAVPSPLPAQDAKTPYPTMAPIEQYRMESTAEIALARTAAIESISGEAEIMVLAPHGYETAVAGKNGFVCMVERSWTAGFDDPEFWNPKLRAPICFNPPAARSYLPLTIKKTQWALAGQSRTQIMDSLKAAFDKAELPALEPGAMCYMLSKQGYLGDHVGHWHPHLMFFLPLLDPRAWGADLPGSTVFAAKVPSDHLTVFLIPVPKWSDGTPDPAL